MTYLNPPDDDDVFDENLAVGERVHESSRSTEVGEIERLVCPLRIGDGIVLTRGAPERVPDRAVLGQFVGLMSSL